MARVEKLILQNQASLAAVPKRAEAGGPPGTMVTVKASDILQTKFPWRPSWVTAGPARAEVRRTNRADNLYGWSWNSNSFVGDVMQATVGKRVGDKATPGYDKRLEGGQFSQEMQRSRAVLGTGFGSTAPGLLLSRLSKSLDGAPGIPMLPGYLGY